MINVTNTAKQEFSNHFEGKEIVPIRVYLAEGGCSGMSLSLALDETRDGDKTVDVEPFIFVINEELAEATGEVTIDMTQYGFTVGSEKQIGGGSGGCSSCASAGGCGH